MRFVVTAGPTREFIDPVRFLSNPSTGRMGFAVARAARAAGHEVTLIAGPVALKTPPGVTRIDVVSARDMLNAVRTIIARADVLVMTAAVADWRPARRAARKLKKTEMSDTLHLVRNPDILKTIDRQLGGPRSVATPSTTFSHEDQTDLVGNPEIPSRKVKPWLSLKNPLHVGKSNPA